MSIESSICEQPKRRQGVFSTGIALFTMFFGAGNLIFPLLIGKTSGSQAPSALLGLMISAVAFPFLGLIAMMFFQGNLHRFLERVGKRPAFWLLFVLQITQGPLCMSRLFTLMHASVKPYLPISLFAFSVLGGMLVFFLTYRPHRIVALLGLFLSPFLLCSLAILAIAGMIGAPDAPIVAEGAGFHFLQGLKGGYMTMDLISALLFATMIFPHLSQGLERLSSKEAKTEMRRKMVGSSAIAAMLLMIAYIGLCFLSAHHSASLQGQIASESLLQALAVKILGPWGGAIASIAIFFACLTTAIALASIFADYLRKDLMKERISPIGSLGATLIVTAALANLGFAGILRIMGPILEVLYPSLIILCLFNIAHCLYEVKPVKTPVFFVLGISLAGFCLG